MFYAIGNIGDSKKTDSSRLTDPDDKYECCVEIMDVELPLSDFPTDTMMNAMGWTEDETTKEKIYTWAKDENLGILYEKIDGEYVLTEDTAVDLNKTYYVDILEHDDFSEDYTYGWRYIYEDGTDEENAEVFDYCKRKWIEFYRFVTTSTDEEFKTHLKDYFVVDSALYYYLFTTRYCMADNRAKNCFLHYGKTGETDSEGNPVRKWNLTWGYDMDTSLGLNNYGKQVYRYGLEDTDVDEKGEEVFRESDSTFFCRIRDLFSAELKAMYNTLESKNAWHAESFLNRCDEWQSEFPEELWRIDIERKYLRTYNGSFINGKGDAQFLENMANGKMKYHRRQWERSQEKYMASKYQSSVASSDNSVFRCSVPSGDLVVAPNYRLKLTPYAYMYLNVKYGTQSPIQLRAEPNVVYEIPFDGEKADIVDVYSSSLIQDFGDLSTCYVATADTSKAEKVKRLIFGNDTPGYDNPNFTSLTTGANYLLEELNIENVSGLTQALDLSALANLRELYAHGSGIGGAAFADGGRIEIAELPAISSLTMKNLVYLTNLDITDLSKLTSLTVEGCDSVDLLELLDAAPNLNRVRLTGIDWSFDDTSLLERLYGMSGYDKNGYNTDRSVLAGQVYVRTIFSVDRDNFKEAWPDLTITYPSEGLIEQHVATFYNEDRTEVLDVQYIVDGEWPVDPTTREDNPITPTIPMTQSHYFTFAGWDKSLGDRMFADKDFYATYDSHLRQYTITYKNELSGEIEQRNTAEYGAYVEYDFEANGVPVYTALEDKMIFYLFREWDKSGYVTGDKVITAQFDVYKYDGGLLTTDFDDMTPVQIYALTKLVEAGEITLPVEGYIEEGSAMTFTLGADADYGDIESTVLIDKETVFDGTNHLDTGLALFEEDHDFMLAIDYKFTSACADGGVLMSCIHPLLSEGVELWYNNYPRLIWNGQQIVGTSAALTSPLPQTGYREMMILRHKKGSGDIMVYRTNITNDEVTSVTVSAEPFTTTITQTLVFGCGKNNSGDYVNYGSGVVYWAKYWPMDLGEQVCRNLASWFHEPLTMEIAAFAPYELADGSGDCSFSMIAKNLIGREVAWNTEGTNSGGWTESTLRGYMDNRVYKAIPQQIRALLKKVRYYSSDGDSSVKVSSSSSYIAAPAYAELFDDTIALEIPYSKEGVKIAAVADSPADRIRMDYTGTAQYYWTRSPRIYTGTTEAYKSYYVWLVRSNGNSYYGTGPNGTSRMLIIFAL